MINETHNFIGAAQTSIYWFEPQERHFWHRLSNRKRVGSSGSGTNSSNYEKSRKEKLTLLVDELKGFYQALLNGELVVLGEIGNSLKTGMIGRLMNHLKAESFLAAPILSQGELLGFLSVEGVGDQVWSEPEKEFVVGAAQLIGLSIPVSMMEDTVTKIEANHLVTTGLAKSIHGDSDWQQVLSQCADQLFEHIGTENLIILLPDLEPRWVFRSVTRPIVVKVDQ